MLKKYNNISGIFKDIENIPNDISQFAKNFREETSFQPKSIYSSKTVSSSSNVGKTVKSGSKTVSSSGSGGKSDIYKIDMLYYINKYKKYWWIPTILVVLSLINK